MKQKTASEKSYSRMYRTVSALLCCMLFSVIGTLFGAEAIDGKKNVFMLDSSYVELEKEAAEAIEKAQAEIASRQRSDGGWNTQYGRSNAGEIAFLTLALMVNGNMPGEGRFSKNIGMSVQFLLNMQRDNGLIADGTQAAMYQHALATLLLSEIYGMSANPRIKDALGKAVNLIVEVQHPLGGWRYQPKPEKGDVSVTVMQVMALRSAAEAGIYVPGETLTRAIRFVKSCYNPKEKGFGYMNGNEKAGFARSAAGVVSMQTCGIYDDPIISDSIPLIAEGGFKTKEWFWYGHYYASVALYHYGGETWKNYYSQIQETILNDWKKRDYRIGNSLETAWGILILGVPYRYLPIYQK